MPAGMRALVGRGAELALAIESMRDAIEAEEVRVVTVVGEAGLGKSVLLDELADRLRRSNIDVETLAGHEMLGAPHAAVAPWVERVGAELDRADPLAIARLLRNDLLRRLARSPVALLVDDAHWLDAASCGALEYLVYADGMAARRPVLLVIATRPTASSDGARVLERLARTPRSRELRLSPLSEAALGALIADAAGASADPVLTRYVWVQAGGNPLQAALVLRDLIDRRAVAIEGGRCRVRGRLPTTPRTALADQTAARLTALDHETVTLVVVAAHLGDTGTVDDLVALAKDHVSDIDRALADANEQGLLVDSGVDWSFGHPMFRSVAEGLRGGRFSQQLHARIAERMLEQTRTDPVAVDRHLAAAGPLVDVDLAAAVATEAGRVALAARGWHLAAGAFQRVLSLVGADRLDTEARAEILCGAAEALWFDCDPRAAVRLYPLAIEAARASGDLVRWGRACEGYLRASLYGHDQRDAVEHAKVMAEAYIAVDPPAAICVRVLIALSDAAFEAGRGDVGAALIERAAAAAREAGTSESLAEVSYGAGLHLLAALDLPAARREFARCAELAVEADDPRLEAWGTDRQGVAAWLSGDLASAEAVGARMLRHNGQHGLWQCLSISTTYMAAVAFARGDTGRAIDFATEAIALVFRSDYPDVGPLAVPHLAAAKLARGDRSGALELIDEATSRGLLVPRFIRDLVDGDGEVSGLRVRPTEHQPGLATVTRLAVGAAMATTPDDGLRRAVEQLERVAAGGLVLLPGWPMTVQRALGRAHACLGNVDSADAWYSSAELVCAQGGLETEGAYLAIDRARLAAATDAGTASRWATAGLRAAARLGLAPLNRSIRDFIDALPPSAGAAPERTLLYTDLVGSTPLNVRLGDEKFVAVLAAHNEIIASVSAEHEGRVFHSTGDGFGVWFASTPDAIAAARRIHRRVTELAQALGEEGLAVRIGIASGSTVPLDGDLYGVAVIRAVRICALAGAGETFLSASAGESASRFGPDLELLKPVTLKGFATPEPILRLR